MHNWSVTDANLNCLVISERLCGVLMSLKHLLIILRFTIQGLMLQPNHWPIIIFLRREFIEYLKAENKKIYLISGGFHSLIDPIARELRIPINNLFANKLLFDFNGNYGTFDANQPTSRSGGKGEAITQIRNFNSSQLQSNNQLKIVMIGDGATDLESAPPADWFIGYGGNVIRDSVRERAQYFVTDFMQLM